MKSGQDRRESKYRESSRISDDGGGHLARVGEGRRSREAASRVGKRGGLQLPLRDKVQSAARPDRASLPAARLG